MSASVCSAGMTTEGSPSASCLLSNGASCCGEGISRRRARTAARRTRGSGCVVVCTRDSAALAYACALAAGIVVRPSSSRIRPIAAADCVTTTGSVSARSATSVGIAGRASSPIRPIARAACQRVRESSSPLALTRSSRAAFAFWPSLAMSSITSTRTSLSGAVASACRSDASRSAGVPAVAGCLTSGVAAGALAAAGAACGAGFAAVSTFAGSTLAGSAGATTAAFGGSGLGCGGVALEQPQTAIPHKTPNHWIDGTRLIATAP